MKDSKLSNKSKKILLISILIKTKNNLINFMKNKMHMKQLINSTNHQKELKSCMSRQRRMINHLNPVISNQMLVQQGKTQESLPLIKMKVTKKH